MAFETINAAGKSVDGRIYSGDKKIWEYDKNEDRYDQECFIKGENYPRLGVRVGLAIKPRKIVSQGFQVTIREAQYYDDFGGLQAESDPTNQWQTYPNDSQAGDALNNAAVAYESNRQDIPSRLMLNAGKLQKAEPNANPPWKETSLPKGVHAIKITAVNGEDISFQTIGEGNMLYYTQSDTYRFRASAIKSGNSDTSTILETARKCQESGTAMHLVMTARERVNNFAEGVAPTPPPLRQSTRGSAPPVNTLESLSQARPEGSNSRGNVRDRSGS